MSYDVMGMAPACDHCGRGSECIFSWNYTTNMAPAWREAGADLAESHGKTSAECAPLLRAAIAKMEAEPERFERFNAPNGWGSMATLVPALRQLLGYFEGYPKTTVQVLS